MAMKQVPGSDVVDGRVFVGGVIPLNVPNGLTILRILLIPVIVGFLVYEQFAYATVTLIVAALTDALDGSIARLTNQKTQFGAHLDPLADKLLLMTAFVTCALMDLVPAWSVIVVVSRDAMLLTGTLLARLFGIPLDASPTSLGKATTLFQLTYVILVLGFEACAMDAAALGLGFFASLGMTPGTEVCAADAAALDPLLFMMSLLTVLSGLHYIVRGCRHVNAAEGS